jgi:CTP-dependent riboflavin kinase
VKVNNKSLYKLFGVSQPKKWECLKKLEDEKMIEINREGKGKSPYVKIILPEKQYH